MSFCEDDIWQICQLRFSDKFIMMFYFQISYRISNGLPSYINNIINMEFDSSDATQPCLPPEIDHDLT